MSGLSEAVVSLHGSTGDFVFIAISAIVIALGVWLIPKATDIATDSAAGLAGEYFGPQQRTLVINSTTNLPELCLMLVSLLGLGRLGGIATPLGSNLANIYLMFLVAPAFILAKWKLQGNSEGVERLTELLKSERKLVRWHLLMSLAMFSFATTTYWVLTGTLQFVRFPAETDLRNWTWLLVGSIVCLVGIVVFFRYENQLKKERPELYEDLDDDDFEASWAQFFFGAVSLIGLCYALNEFFVAWTSVYSSQFAGYALFAALHFFVGSLISSLPEITVAIENYEKVTPPELNTALASASQSNMTNLAIAGIGCVLAIALLLTGYVTEL